MAFNICLVHNASSGRELNWVRALNNHKDVKYKTIDLTRHDWITKIQSENCDLVIAIPNGTLSDKKQMFDERLYVINHVLGLPIYPTYNELITYENKRLLSYWLKAHKIPHPHTEVFYNYDEAQEFINHVKLPVVAKSNIGASGSGVYILKSKKAARRILNKTFKGNGFPRRKGPNYNKDGVYKRILSKLNDKDYIIKKLRHYQSIKNDIQIGQILFQEFIPHEFEWRTIKIGNTYISHQKVLKGDRASGTGLKKFIEPNIEMLEFVKSVAEKLNFNSASFDLYKTKDGYLINEIQTYYGTPHIMKKNGVLGRYINTGSEWVFEEGDFSLNHTCDLRLIHALDLLNKGKL